MKLIGWAIALAAAGLTPAAAQAPQAEAPAAQAAQAAPAAVDHSAHAVPAAQVTPPTPGIGVPVGGKGIQEQVTPIGEEAAWFHDVILMPLITAIVGVWPTSEHVSVTPCRRREKLGRHLEPDRADGRRGMDSRR